MMTYVLIVGSVQLMLIVMYGLAGAFSIDKWSNRAIAVGFGLFLMMCMLSEILNPLALVGMLFAWNVYMIIIVRRMVKHSLYEVTLF
jgi:hypothetical protein